MKLLDLFCGAGGAAMGYHRAGFTEIIGVDIKSQPRYPFQFIQADALNPPLDLSSFDVIHASPPCQRFSKCTPEHAKKNHPNTIARVRRLVKDKPYVIENVDGARHEMHHPVVLCGTQFRLRVLRHRYFESNIMILAPGRCSHKGLLEGRDYVSVHDGTMNGNSRNVLKAHGCTMDPKMSQSAYYQAAMGIDWMRSRKEIAEAIPPAYTEWIGNQLMQSLRAVA